MKFFARKVQYPHVRDHHYIFFTSQSRDQKGQCKSAWMLCFANMLGLTHVTIMTSEEFGTHLMGQFTESIANKCLVIIDDADARLWGKDGRFYESFKSLVSSPFYISRHMREGAEQKPNFLTITLSGNDPNPIPERDRRGIICQVGTRLAPECDRLAQAGKLLSEDPQVCAAFYRLLARGVPGVENGIQPSDIPWSCRPVPAPPQSAAASDGQATTMRLFLQRVLAQRVDPSGGLAEADIDAVDRGCYIFTGGLFFAILAHFWREEFAAQAAATGAEEPRGWRLTLQRLFDLLTSAEAMAAAAGVADDAAPPLLSREERRVTPTAPCRAVFLAQWQQLYASAEAGVPVLAHGQVGGLFRIGAVRFQAVVVAMFGLDDGEADADGASSEPLEPNDDVFSTLMYDCLLKTMTEMCYPEGIDGGLEDGEEEKTDRKSVV